MLLNVVLELILFTIIVGGARFGYNKGLFKITARLMRKLLCILLSISLSRLVGGYFIAPLILSRISEQTRNIAYPIVQALSMVIAFIILFFLLKIIMTFVISIIGRIFDEGVLGGVNKLLGFMLSGTAALIAAMCLASIIEYLLLHGAFDRTEITRGFSGGLLYRILALISPLKLLLIN